MAVIAHICQGLASCSQSEKRDESGGAVCSKLWLKKQGAQISMAQFSSALLTPPYQGSTLASRISHPGTCLIPTYDASLTTSMLSAAIILPRPRRETMVSVETQNRGGAQLCAGAGARTRNRGGHRRLAGSEGLGGGGWSGRLLSSSTVCRRLRERADQTLVDQGRRQGAHSVR